MKISKKNIFTAVVLILTLQALQTKAAWGDYDTSFGFGGVAIDSVTGYFPRDTAIQPDGKILVTGYRKTIFVNRVFFLRRYLSNGELDTSFGNGGEAIVSNPTFFKADYRGTRILVQVDGKISVGGWTGKTLANGTTQGVYAVWQFTSNGKSDSGFGQNGLQILTNYPIRGHIFPELFIQNGKLLLGLPKPSESLSRFALIRLTSTGALDNSFGVSGESSTTINDFGLGMVVERNGKIVVSGRSVDYEYSVILERKTANGQPDPTFFSTPTPSLSGIPTGLVKLANGKFIVRRYDLGGGYGLWLTSFGSNGIYESNVELSFDLLEGGGCPYIFANQNDGKLLVTEWGKIYRLTSDLNPGTKEIFDCSNLFGSVSSSAIQPDDKMVSVGVYDDKLILMRTLSD